MAFVNLEVAVIFVSALGLLLNTYVLVILSFGKHTHEQETANTLLLIHLGAVEAAVCLIILIFTTGAWSISGTWCLTHGFLLTLLHPIALWTITGLNCDRYYAIASPLHYVALVSRRRVASGLAASWCGALLLCLPPFSGLVPPYSYNPGLGCCVPDFGSDKWRTAAAVYGAVYMTFGLLLPTVLVTVCNLRVLGIARYHRHRIASAIYEVTLSAQVTITHQRNPFFIPSVTSPSAGGPPKFHSAASTVMQLIGSVYLLYVPFCGFILWEAVGSGIENRTHAHPHFASIAAFLLACSPPVNSLLYGLKSRTLRRSVQNYWRKKATKSELQQEIQARTPSVAGSRRQSGSGTMSIFPLHPPLQRRLSEALLNLRSSNNYENGSAFQKAKLHTAASCNTLRVPNVESGYGAELVRTSASALSLSGPRYRSDFCISESIAGCSSAKRSPRILITQANSEESQDTASPLLGRAYATFETPCEKRKWKLRSNESDSSTGSSDASVWTTGVAPKTSRNNFRHSDLWPFGRKLAKAKILKQITANECGNNSESSDTTENTATTTTSIFATNSATNDREDQLTEARSKTHLETNRIKARIRDASDSEGSWSSVDEEEGKIAKESNEEVFFDYNVNDKSKTNKNQSSDKSDGKKNVQQDRKNWNVLEDLEDREETAQLKPLLASSF